MSSMRTSQSKNFWSVAAEYRGRFFGMQTRCRHFFMDNGGYWLFPGLRTDERGDLEWLHLMLPAQEDRRKLKLFAPSALAVTSPDGCSLWRYEVLCSDGSKKPVAVYPWRGIANLTVAEYEDLETSLVCSYRMAGECFLETGTLPEGFAALYRKLTPRRLLAFLRGYAPEFVAALSDEDDGREEGR